MSGKVEVGICSGGIARGYQGAETSEEIQQMVAAELNHQSPDKSWTVSTISCFRFCPEKRITLSVGQRMSMTREATIKSIVHDVLSFCPNKN